MVIGVCRFELVLEDNCSLKGKRSVIRPLVAHVRQRFNVAIAEVDDHDDWERAVLGFAVALGLAVAGPAAPMPGLWR